MAGSGAALLQIFLVIFFGAVELACWGNLRRNRPAELAARLQRRTRLLCDSLLLRRMKENRRAVLRPEVRTLAVHLRRIVRLPEHLEQLLVTYFGGIERDLHHFSVS